MVFLLSAGPRWPAARATMADVPQRALHDGSTGTRFWTVGPRPGGEPMRSVTSMGASTLLETTELSIMPGSEATATLRIRNTGTVVDQFTFQPLGTAAPWMTVDPPQVSMLPGTEETVRVTFRPPRVATTLAGTTPWAIRALSQEDPEGSVVDEGVITIEAFDDRALEMTPRTAR